MDNGITPDECNRLGGSWDAGMCKYGDKSSSTHSSNPKKVSSVWASLLPFILVTIALAGAYLLSEVLAGYVAPIVTILGLIYIISPVDLIPDFLPIAGWLDDGVVIVLVILSWIFQNITKWVLLGLIIFYGFKIYSMIQRKR
jgi:uncharacterized membrane protein YkvA (DUF1232 family)